MQYLYFHGFASSPHSTKAAFFKQQLASQGLPLTVLDLNQPTFRQLKFSYLQSWLAEQLDPQQEYCLIGSSMGGLLALNMAEQFTNISKLVLLAPAISLKSLLPSLIGADNMKLWHERGSLPVYHSGLGAESELDYCFIEDLQLSQDCGFQRQISCQIYHGLSDATIPVQVSREYVRTNSLASLIELDGEHGLEPQLNIIWQQAASFIIN